MARTTLTPAEVDEVWRWWRWGQAVKVLARAMRRHRSTVRVTGIGTLRAERREEGREVSGRHSVESDSHDGDLQWLPQYEPGTTTARRWSRDGSRRVFARRYGTVLYAFVVLMGTVLSVGPTAEAFAGDPGRIRSATATVAGVVTVLAWRILRLAVVVTPGRVVIRNLLMTHRIRVNDIDRFEPPKGTFRAGIRLVRRSGRFTSATAFTRMSNFDSEDRGLLETAELNAWLADATNGHQPTGLRPLLPWTSLATVGWRVWLATISIETVLGALIVIANIADPTTP